MRTEIPKPAKTGKIEVKYEVLLGDNDVIEGIF